MLKKLIFFFWALMALIALLFFFAWSNRGALTYNFYSKGVYALDMRASKVTHGKGKIYYAEKKWRMDIPREYVLRHKGLNGVMSWNPKTKRTNRFALTLSGAIDTDNMTITPFSGGAKGRLIGGENSVLITLRNMGGKLNLPESMYCFTPAEFNAVLGSKLRGKKCDLTRPGLCDIQMILDGWQVQLSLDKALYPEAELSCEVVQRFLNKQTIIRNKLNN